MAGTQQLERSATEQLGAGPAPPELRQLAERANAALAKGQQQLAAEQGEAAGWEPRRSCRPRLRSEAIASLPQQLVLLLARQSSCGAAVSLTAPPAADRRFPTLCRRRRCRHRVAARSAAHRRACGVFTPAFCMPERLPAGTKDELGRADTAAAELAPRDEDAHTRTYRRARGGSQAGRPALECCTVLP